MVSLSWDLWGPGCRAQSVIQDKAWLSLGSVLAQARGKRAITAFLIRAGV